MPQPEEYRRREVRTAGDDVAAGAVANVAAFLKGAPYPARRTQLEETARENGADESAIEEIRHLPEDRFFDNPVEVFTALGDEIERTHQAHMEHEGARPGHVHRGGL